MTIASQTSRISYTGDGSTTGFPVPFYFQANADLVVSVQDLSGNVTTKLLGTDYNLTGATLSAGGTCTFTMAPTSGFIIAITRVPKITQTTSYNNNDPFPAKSHELALDKATTVDQYLKSLIDRSILVAATDSPPTATLPPASVRALKNFSFDSLGNPTVSTPITGTTVSAAMIPVVQASTLPIARQLMGLAANATTFSTRALAAAATIDSAVQIVAVYGYAVAGDLGDAIYKKVGSQPSHSGKFQSVDGAWWEIVGPVYNWRAFGAVGDGVADDTAAIQGTVNAAQTTGGTSFGPPGSYKVTAPINVTSSVNIKGSGYESDYIVAGAGTDRATKIVAYNTMVFNVTTDHSVFMEMFGITYLTTPTVTTTPAILIDAGTEAIYHANKETRIRDVYISNPGIGINVINGLGFTFDHIHIEGAAQNSMLLQDVNFPGSGDSNVTNCTMSGAPPGHMLIKSGGGLRVANNKFNSSATGGANIIIQSAITTSQSISPLLIVGNSLENAAAGSVGILAQQTSGNMLVLDYVIACNEFLCATGILVQANAGLTQWFIDGVIANNIINCSSTGISLDSVGSTNISGNMIFGAATGITIGSHNSGLKISGNNYGAGTSPPAPSGPSLPASTVAGTNTNPFAVIAYISGGTVAAIIINGATTGLLAGSFMLNPGDTFQINYSAAPGFLVKAVNP